MSKKQGNNECECLNSCFTQSFAHDARVLVFTSYTVINLYENQNPLAVSEQQNAPITTEQSNHEQQAD